MIYDVFLYSSLFAFYSILFHISRVSFEANWTKLKKQNEFWKNLCNKVEGKLNKIEKTK
jgi:hypothetical protein